VYISHHHISMCTSNRILLPAHQFPKNLFVVICSNSTVSLLGTPPKFRYLPVTKKTQQMSHIQMLAIPPSRFHLDRTWSFRFQLITPKNLCTHRHFAPTLFCWVHLQVYYLPINYSLSVQCRLPLHQYSAGSPRLLPTLAFAERIAEAESRWKSISMNSFLRDGHFIVNPQKNSNDLLSQPNTYNTYM
jgi:hypothetical protein